MPMKSVLEKLWEVEPRAELWWDSSPLLYAAWKKQLLTKAPPESHAEWDAQLTRLFNEADPAASLRARYDDAARTVPYSAQEWDSVVKQWRLLARLLRLRGGAGDAARADALAALAGQYAPGAEPEVWPRPPVPRSAPRSVSATSSSRLRARRPGFAGPRPPLAPA